MVIIFIFFYLKMDAEFYRHKSLYWNTHYANLMEYFSLFLCGCAVLTTHIYCVYLYFICICFCFVVKESSKLLNMQLRMILKDESVNRAEFYNLLNKINICDYNLGQEEKSVGCYVLKYINYIRDFTIFSFMFFVSGFSVQCYYLFNDILKTTSIICIFSCTVFITVYSEIADVRDNFNNYVSWVPKK